MVFVNHFPSLNLTYRDALKMAPLSAIWQLFHTNNEHYLNDKSHKNAFCKGCVKDWTDRLLSSDSSAVATGELDAVQSSEELKQAG